jgi:hypothetical protein
VRLLALAAALVAGGVPAPVVQTGFLTPSGNIDCNAGPDIQSRAPILTCTVFSAASLTRGQKLWTLETKGRTQVGYLMANAATGLPRLPYGHTWRWRGFSCASEATGLTCRNPQGHGFFLSRESQRVF